jgi:hypothetical protein
MNKNANKLTLAALCLGALVNLPACSCTCKKPEVATEQTAPAAPTEAEQATAVDMTGVEVAQVEAAAPEAAMNMPEQTELPVK